MRHVVGTLCREQVLEGESANDLSVVTDRRICPLNEDWDWPYCWSGFQLTSVIITKVQ